jgi:hypothetical protein
VNTPMVSSHGHMENGLKEAPVQNSNYVPVNGFVEYFDKILLQMKIKWAQSDFIYLGSHNFHLKYRIGEILWSLER